MAGCAGGAETFSPSDPEIQISGYYNDGAADRDLRLVVIGNPFPAMADDAFKQALQNDLQSGSVLGRAPTTPKLDPGPSAKPIYRLVYAFGQPTPVYGNVLCQIDPNHPVPVRPGGEVTATAAFCVGGEAESFISGDAQAAGPTDPHFVELARQMMDDVFRPDFQWRGNGGSSNMRNN